MTRNKQRRSHKKGPDVCGLFGEHDAPDHNLVWDFYERARSFNMAIDLDETVKTNENFFVGKQWEGVQSNGLPTPVFNILKRVVLFTVATITTDNIKVQATPLSSTPNTQALVEPVRVVNEEFEAVMEHNNIPALMREFARNAAVDADGCLYSYWDPDVETGQDAKGAIRTEIIENTRVFFGNPNDRRVQSQPWMIIESRDIDRIVRRDAKENGVEDWESIRPDTAPRDTGTSYLTDDKVTRLLFLWRDDESKEIWGFECTQSSDVRPAFNTGLRRYPIVWLSWDYIQDSYHGQAMLTGLIPNQIFINKMYAMSMLSLMTTAYPKIIYDKTRVKAWDNRVGAAIGINGGDVSTVAKIMDPAAISPQIAQFIELAVTQTEQNLGATSVALGDTRPDNTSAIIALQRAASTPSEITKQNLYKCIEDLFRIYLEFMGEYYGVRKVDAPVPQQLDPVFQFVGMEPPAEIPIDFDFGILKEIPMSMKLDVGASSYYSEIASIQTLDNLLKLGKITTRQYLERIPDGYIPSRRQLVDEIRRQEQSQMAAMQGGGQIPEAAPVSGSAEKPELPTGGGYSALQRKVNETGTTEGLV